MRSCQAISYYSPSRVYVVSRKRAQLTSIGPPDWLAYVVDPQLYFAASPVHGSIATNGLARTSRRHRHDTSWGDTGTYISRSALGPFFGPHDGFATCGSSVHTPPPAMFGLPGPGECKFGSRTGEHLAVLPRRTSLSRTVYSRGMSSGC